MAKELQTLNKGSQLLKINLFGMPITFFVIILEISEIIFSLFWEFNIYEEYEEINIISYQKHLRISLKMNEDDTVFDLCN